MANKMRDERSKLVEIKGSGIACVNMEWFYTCVIGKIQRKLHCIMFGLSSTDWKYAVYINTNQ